MNDEKRPLQVIESSNGSEISGYYFEEAPADKWVAGETFHVPVSLEVTRETLRQLVGDLVRYDEGTVTQAGEEISFREFKGLLWQNAIVLDGGEDSLQLITKPGSDKATLVGQTKKLAEGASSEEGAGPAMARFRVDVPNYMYQELEYFVRNGADLKKDNGVWQSVLLSFLPIFVLLLLLFFLFRHQMKSAGRGAMNFGKSKARLLSMDKNKVTFKDVAGIQEAKEELQEIVEYLRDPRKFQKLGGSIPKGVLMVGSPGTGKTLLARAIAGEADVPFFSISGSDFVEMFVGVGASRVRDMFEQGKKNAPCLIFIDEIDAVGRHRGHGMGGGHDEREQTLNALLVEMDGFDTQEGIIIIAATNRPDVLDPALLRPGRFDREVTVSLPDVKGRAEILRVHSKKIKLSADVDLDVIARGTPGFSGAELANLINESALLAARKNLKAVTLAELEEARDKVRWGRERRSLALSEDDKRKTAYHEAGHAILNVVLPHTDPLHKVTIIPRGPSLGSTMFLPEKDKFSYHKLEMLDELVVLMGGRVAEEIVLDDVASGASGDIRMATNLARSMVCEWGMSDALGMVEYGDGGGGEVFLARDMAKTKNYSEATAQTIDSEIKRIIDEAYAKATELLTKHREDLDVIAEALMEYETLDGAHIEELMKTGGMSNPPRSPKPPEVPDGERKTSQKPADSSSEDDDEPLAGDVVGVPA
ncbi:ATP-dependent zinc metalloprotease FtsH [Roseibacillus ishigakijimensis]|uniref:ATP-dependent zinc metalloprotease FtsH n=2 Tax=Roseibacillus ishigakijimensis TaxID=454146 RepID=A0A934RPV9_9BACT|nr:ATP-dependent zinc metalloprotease FtsH [Roseibacillus ishigakijimensis]